MLVSNFHRERSMGMPWVYPATRHPCRSPYLSREGGEHCALVASRQAYDH